MTMKVAICAIARFENPYIREWVDYHLGIGFSHIYLYDNNREGEERIADVLDVEMPEYRGRVDIIPFHDVETCPQMKAYRQCYTSADSDWIAFIDLDEFITLSPSCGYHSVPEFLADRRDCDAVLLNWMCYGDSGKTFYEERPLLERLKTPLPKYYSVSNLWGKQPINGHVKTLVRTGLDFEMTGPHVGQGSRQCEDAEGRAVENVPYQPRISHEVLYVRHFITKTIEEYIRTKGRRPAADGAFGYYSISSFFWYNKPTIFKLRIWRTYCKEHHVRDERSALWWLKVWIKMWIITPLFVK